VSQIAPVGYQGQKYEVRCAYGDDTQYRVGWTNDASGGKLVEMINLHPCMSNPVVLELSPREKEILKAQWDVIG
jgi:hypothetical protein